MTHVIRVTPITEGGCTYKGCTNQATAYVQRVGFKGWSVCDEHKGLALTTMVEILAEDNGVEIEEVDQ